ncbi:non-structural maintenance of chromosomes element 4 homolog A isoform X1 [Gouania willdenowi]|uniref:non-structural maintenance of chromosomes element 4 homolog A isoform X1 n=1 Tax=Gouania willdenowi TaxID=441366 RepID=UPI001054FB56|nr:protein ANTAGONIST OF LIKE HETEROCHROMATIN PROTEIN 1-like isoform X1 [Gouania willdenowi]
MMDIACLQVLILALQAYIKIQGQTTLLLQAIRLRRMHRERRLRLRRQVVLRLIARRSSCVSLKHPRSGTWWDCVVPGLSAQEFVQSFHMSRESFKYICDRTEDLLAKDDRLCVPVQKLIAIAIRKLATGSNYMATSQQFGVGLSTVFNCVQEFCKAVLKGLLPVHIRTPDSAQLIEKATFFKNHWEVPQCVGVIDARHIPVNVPEKYLRDYCNRRGWHSMVLQAVVDGKGLFWDVCVGFPGSVRYERVLRQSQFWKDFGDGQLLGQNKVTESGCDVGHYLIGDAAYPMHEWLMKPFLDTGSLTPEQKMYNSRLKYARSVAETAFRRLKGRWRCLLKKHGCKLELSKKIALTCCVLHNICEDHGDIFIEEFPEGHVLYAQPPVTPLPDKDPKGTDIRAALMECFNHQ